MNCIIVEDQAPAQRVLQKFIADIGSLRLAGTFTDALGALHFLNENKVDLIFLDIHLPKISGMDFLKMLPQPPAVILTTAFSEYAVESYEHNVVDYLVKPFSFGRFAKAVAKAATTYNGSSEGRTSLNFYLKSGHEQIKVNAGEILYIHSDMDYTELHLPNKKHLSSETLAYWEEKFPKPDFWRVHKSYLVNTSKIEKVAGNQIYLPHQKVVPIGRAFKEAFIAYISR